MKASAVKSGDVVRRLVPALVVAALLSACAVKTYPREVTTLEKMQTNYAHSFDTFGAKLISRINYPPGYDLSRQIATIDFDYYRGPELRQNPRSFYPRPEAPPQIEIAETLESTPAYEVLHLVWPSQYAPGSPAFAPAYEEYVECHTGHAVMVKSKTKNSGAIVWMHGWTGGDVRETYQGEGMIEMAAAGYDSVLLQHPYHGLRAPADSKFSGEYYISGELARINEAIRQSVTDARSLALWLRQSYPVVGARGGSLGGINTLMTAAVEDRIDFAVAWVPPSSLGDIPEDTPLAPDVVKGIRASGVDRELAQEILFVSGPANFQPAIPKERVLIFAGMGDNFVPPAQPAKVWEAWGEPHIYWFAGGHVLNFEKKECKTIERDFVQAFLP